MHGKECPSKAGKINEPDVSGKTRQFMGIFLTRPVLHKEFLLLILYLTLDT